MFRRTTLMLAGFALWGATALAAGGTIDERSDLSADQLARVRAVTKPTEDFSKPEQFENKSGGAGTFVGVIDENAFSHFTQNMSFADQEQFNLGNALFRKEWVSAPSSTEASDGLGPIFNSRSCQTCHLKDGRGHPPMTPEERASSMFLRLSVPPKTPGDEALLTAHGANVLPDPTYGTQLQNFAVPGLMGEGEMAIAYTDLPVELGDGTVVTLRSPQYALADLNYGPADPEIMLSPRVAPPMIGLGLLEAVPAADILAHADPDDTDGDGISGRPNWVTNPVSGDVELGRFGWKAGEATIRAQSAGAFAGDIGISTPLVPHSYGDCTENEPQCLAMPNGEQENLGPTEAPDPVLDLVNFYSQNLAVPERRNSADANVLAGKELFYSIGCFSCHTPKYVTSRNADNAFQQFQLIWPYTDMLLHDMGEGLADHRPEGEADGYEWRTQPLWGVGLTETVSGHTLLLHDGRARNILEAVLWHGGEAQNARDAVVAMDKTDRDNLIVFLESL
ncbi:MAG: thiol oxidoreductase [Hyphomicrobiaceae bacterium]|nr:thiol oxidoreductase [Hyphomicrobiaceae bacterium]